MNTSGIRWVRFVMVFFVSLCVFFTIPPAANAETQYVSDLLIISVRDGQEPDAPVLGYLRSATPLEVLDETDELMNIRTEDGLQGWVRKKFIVAEKPKAAIILDLNEKIAMLEEELKLLNEVSDAEGLKKIIQGHQQEITHLTDALQNEKKATAQLKKELKQANLKIQQLSTQQKAAAQAGQELAALKEENNILQEKIASQPPPAAPGMLSGQMKWFLIGSGVLLLGFIIGRSVKKTRRYGY